MGFKKHIFFLCLVVCWKKRKVPRLESKQFIANFQQNADWMESFIFEGKRSYIIGENTEMDAI